MSRADIEKLAKKGTGRHGMLTKGDVLFALGKAKSARGSASKLQVTKYGVEGQKSAEVRSVIGIGEALADLGIRSQSTSTTPPAGKKEPELILDGAALRRLILGGLEKITKPALPISSRERMFPTGRRFWSTDRPRSSHQRTHRRHRIGRHLGARL